MTRLHRAAVAPHARATLVGLAVVGAFGCTGCKGGSVTLGAPTLDAAIATSAFSSAAPQSSVEPAASVAPPVASATALPAVDPDVERLIVWGRPEVGSGDEPSLPLGLYMAIPRWSEERGLYTELGFGVMRTYVEGLKTCGLEVSGLPESLKDARVPAAFAQVSRKLPRFKVLGWSLLPADADAIAAVERAFSRKGKHKARSVPPASVKN
jgi:hypothetical protein